jgi:membrane protease YdiL (CAAX protease family)
MWSILIAAGLFVLPHLATKSVSFLPFLFITAVLLGFIYLKSGSMLIPMWGHATANASWFGGVVAILVYILISGLGALINRNSEKEHSSVPATGSRSKEL